MNSAAFKAIYVFGLHFGQTEPLYTVAHFEQI